GADATAMPKISFTIFFIIPICIIYFGNLAEIFIFATKRNYVKQRQLNKDCRYLLEFLEKSEFGHQDTPH
ncbi:MAG: hypothetical protein K2J78_01675, partial [Muribaculaceae bacterium]|nr:hypothetical protein [Muribaculaceae bacterium]